jgi:hypothetical protein
MYNAWNCIHMALSEVAACREGDHAGENIEWILAAVAVIQREGPVDLPPEKAVRLVLDVLQGRRNVNGALLSLFRG